MNTEVRCPYCSRSFTIAEDALDKQVQCPACQESFEAILLAQGASGEGEITDRLSPQVARPLATAGGGREAEEDWGEEPRDRPRKSGVPVGLVVALVVGLALLFALLLGGGGVVWFLAMRARTAEAQARAEAVRAMQQEKMARVQAQEARRMAEEALQARPAPGAARAPRAEMKLLQKIPTYHAAAFSRDSQRALIVFPEGKVEVRSAPNFLVAGTAKLPGEAHEAVLTAEGILITAGRDPGALSFFSVADLLAGKAPPGVELEPAATIPVGGEVADLSLSPEGDKVYYLDKTNRTIGRVDTAGRKADGQLPGLAAGTDRMCRSPDGKTLYTLSPEGIHYFDTAAWKPAGAIPQPFVGRDLQATDAGRVFVLDAPGPLVVVTAVSTAEAGRREVCAKVGTADALLLAPDQQRLYVSNCKQAPAETTAYHIPPGGQGFPLGGVRFPANAAARGKMVISPDGRFLLCDAGAILSVK